MLAAFKSLKLLALSELEFARLRRFRVGCHNTAEWAEAGSPRVGSRRAQEASERALREGSHCPGRAG